MSSHPPHPDARHRWQIQNAISLAINEWNRSKPRTTFAFADDAERYAFQSLLANYVHDDACPGPCADPGSGETA